MLYTRATRLLQACDGPWRRQLQPPSAQVAPLDVLILDDLAIATIAAQERHDLLELLDDRTGSRSTLITSQLPFSTWHAYLNEPTIADAILDQLWLVSHSNGVEGRVAAIGQAAA